MKLLIITRAEEEVSHRRACRRFRVCIFFDYLGGSRGDARDSL